MRRRDLFKAGAVAGAALVLPAQRVLAAAAGTPVTAAPFTMPLRVPPVLTPVRSTLSTDYYEMAMRHTDVEIIPGTTTRVLSYGGEFPGPTIHALRGRRVVVRHTNNLTEDVVVHLHGGHTAAEHDGFPTDVMAPGESRDYVYENQQQAATLWYHDHAHHLESEHVFLGLSGFYLLHDAREVALALPAGPYDVPMLFRDARFDDNAALVYNFGDVEARNVILVNGRPRPFFPVAARRYRLRLLNGANDRAFKFSLSDGGELTQISSDGGLLPEPVTTNTVQLFPGERADVLIDFSRYQTGTQVVLRNEFGESEETTSVLRFDVGRPARDFSRVPRYLPSMPALPRASVTRDVALAFDLSAGAFLINGKKFDPDTPMFRAKLGVPEVWRVTNTDPYDIPHNLHLHLVQFRVLDRDGTPVGPEEAGWKDTVTVWPGETVRIAVTFTGHTGRYVFHCHLLDHAASAMMARIDVVP